MNVWLARGARHGGVFASRRGVRLCFPGSRIGSGNVAVYLMNNVVACSVYDKWGMVIFNVSSSLNLVVNAW